MTNYPPLPYPAPEAIDTLVLTISESISDLIMDSLDIPIEWNALNDLERERAEEEFYDLRYFQLMECLMGKLIMPQEGKHRA